LPDAWLRGVYGPAHESPTIDASVAHSARVYDYLLGGKDHFAADRTAGDQMIAALPNVVTGSRMNRAFLARAVRFLVAECGIRQFLDIGTGIPSAGNTHEVAQEIAPQTRVVYVDNDPIVLSHARALLTSTVAGAVAYLDADLRHPDGILRTAARTLDFQQPIALMMLMVLHMIPDAEEPHQIVARFVDALPGGSYLALSHPPSDILPEGVAQVQQRLNAPWTGSIHDRPQPRRSSPVLRRHGPSSAGARAGSPVAAIRRHRPEGAGFHLVCRRPQGSRLTGVIQVEFRFSV
jgi:S-adenosyl methyltransferase